MLRKYKIGRRLILGYTILLLLSITTSVVAIMEINNIWSDTKNLYEKPYAATSIIKEIKINALNIRRYMLDMILISEQTRISELISSIDREERLGIDNFRKLEQIYAGQAIGLGESLRFFVDWKPLRDNVIDLTLAGNLMESSGLIVTRNREYVSELFEVMQVPIDNITAMAQDFYENALETKEKIFISLLVILAVSLLISIFLAWLITRSIATPIGAIVSGIQEISKGNLDNPRIQEKNDEIGQLAASFNRMQDNLIHKALIARRISQGDFSARVEISGDKDMLAESINMIANNFDQVVNQARKVADGDFRTELAGMTESNQLMVVISMMLESLREVVTKAKKISRGDFSGEIIPKSESDELSMALNKMTESLRSATEQNARQTRLKTAQNELNERMGGDQDTRTLSDNIITYVAGYTKAQIGAIWLWSEERKGFQLSGRYAYTPGSDKTFLKPGESLVGQAGLKKEIIMVSDVPEDYIRISSGLGDTVPKYILIAPFVYENTSLGVIELGSIREFNSESFEFLQLVLENIAVSVMSAESRTRMARLLEITRSQTEELQVQQEELRQANEELESQTVALKFSEENLQRQQEELRVTNVDLEEKTRRLEEHKTWMEEQNIKLEKARQEVEKKARELEISNKYKSEFLANMSHELRTPLNSLLLLSQSLMENRQENLSPQQVEWARIIFNSGNDLLKLINDILDLSRIESGKMNLIPAKISVSSITASMRDYFSHIIHRKGLDFSIKTEPDVPGFIFTDEQRLNQILRNILSNAVKFTEKGSIGVRIFKPGPPEGENRVAFAIRDTGIGIPENRQMDIFEAFQQVDGSISRKYAGSGLGLSISRELARILGGRIDLSSKPGEGSEFTVIIPAEYKEKDETIEKQAIAESRPVEKTNRQKQQVERPSASALTPIADDRDQVTDSTPYILIIEDDVKFAGLLAGICRDKGFRCINAVTGEEALQLLTRHKPKGIVLDINLPGIDGWSVLDHLKTSSDTRHIPVHIISGYEETIEAFNKGAVGYLTKPVTREKIEEALDQMQSYMPEKIRNLLIIEDDTNLRRSVRMLLDARDIDITEATTADEAMTLIGSRHFDCIVLDLGLPDMNGFDMLRTLEEKNIKVPPVVVYTGKELTREENTRLQHYTHNIIIKGVKSEERLLDETALFLHRVVKDMPDHQKKILASLYDKEEMFRGKHILIVDDDMRNVFAITAVLEAGNMKVLTASDGKKALEVLGKNQVDLVLMDIMMPEMDGYETVRQIRTNRKLRNLPVIMLTAKAMKDDRDKSLAAGANDYLSKPVDVEKLLNLMRIWLYR